MKMRCGGLLPVAREWKEWKEEGIVIGGMMIGGRCS
jgi:hypothetical protein